MRELPIGFIDSGFGGLTVVKQSLKQLPNESIIYLGDNARCPYGPRALDEVRRYIWQLTNFLREQGIKMLVIACNTGTAAALAEIRQTLAIPVVGVIHSGSRAAIKETRNNHIGIIGTQGTIDSGLYSRTIKEKSAIVEVDSLACPSFVELVEKDFLEKTNTQSHVDKILTPLVNKGIDTLVLGCTHYPLMKQNIQKAVGNNIYLVDSGVETINEVSMLLDYFNLSRTAKEVENNPPTQTYFTTGEVEPFYQVASSWLKEKNLNINKVHIKGEVLVGTTDRKS